MANSIFAAPLNVWSDEAVLAYFQERTHVHYFAIVDEEQCSPEQIAGVLANRFIFNDELHSLPSGFDWRQNPSQDIEWLILLHKFYYAVGLGKQYQERHEQRYLDKWVELTSQWIGNVPLDFLSSDVMGRRVQNWIFAYYAFVDQSHAPLPAAFHQAFLASLHSQVCHLCTHLTPARNHRTIELYAIFLAAVVFPEMEDAKEWLTFSRQLLLENMRADYLPDGVHCELSTDYHHLVLRNHLGIMKLAKLNQIEMPAEMDGFVQRALEFAKYIHKPDGLVPSLSDGDVRDFRGVLLQGYELYGDAELLYVATRGKQGHAPRYRSRSFPDGGYAIQRSGWGERAESFVDERYLLLDCGPLGAGNHGHLDALSFEMAAYGRSLILDPGRYTYHEPTPESGECNWRARFRGTAYHNTVMVDGKEQTRYMFHKNRFRILGPAPDTTLKEMLCYDAGNGEVDFLHAIAASHEYPVIHERKILFAHRAYWVITDILRPQEQKHGQEEGQEQSHEQSHQYNLHFHLNAEAQGNVTSHMEGAGVTIHAPNLLLLHCSPAHRAAYEVLEGYIAPTYGLKVAAPILRFSYHGRTLVTHTVLYPYSQEQPTLHLEMLPVMRSGEVVAASDAFALQLSIQHGEQAFTDTLFVANSAANNDTQGAYTFRGHNCTGPLHFARSQLEVAREHAR